MEAFDLLSILHLPRPPPLGMQLIAEIRKAAAGATAADQTLSGSRGTNSAQSQLQALAGETSFGR